MNTLKDRIAELSPEKRALLMKKLKQQHPASALPAGIAPRADQTTWPLSYAQQRMWFLDQLETGSPLYNISAALRLSGQLDRAAFEAALNEIIRRHEILRATFTTEKGWPVERIAPALTLSLTATDLQHLPETERETEARRLAIDEARQPFNLSEGPLLRARLLRLNATEHIALITLHHIVADGWSTGVFIREIVTLYDAITQGRPSPLAELKLQYADFAHWQRETLQGDTLAQQSGYWKEKLSGELPSLSLPTDRPRPAVQTYNGAHYAFTLSRPLTEALTKLSQQEGATLFMTLLAAFQTLLCRYTGQDDLCVGSPIANRHRAELEDLIGFFVNTLVLRGDLSGEPSFRELLQRVKGTALDAYAHQDLPFEMIVDEVQAQRDLSRTPLFQVMFLLQQSQLPLLKLPGLHISLMEVDPGTAKFDLLLLMEESPEGLRGDFEYNTDLFDRETIARLVTHFQTLLESIVGNPDESIARLSLLSEAERRQILTDWNDTARAYPRDLCLHHLFEAQVARTPDAVALVFEDQHLTYQQLSDRADLLARCLQSRGVGPEVLVGVCAERSLEMVIALYAILRAGGAYLPLDPGYPADRLAFMLADSQARIVLTQSHLQARLAQLAPELETICLDTDQDAMAHSHAPELRREVQPEHLAYVIYTSGSTGQPKGSLIEHRSIVNRLLWMQDEYHLQPGDVVLQKTPFSFDVSVWEFFWPLLCGARLVLARPDGHRDNAYLVSLIQQQQVTTLHFVPPMLSLFLEAPGVSECPSLRRVICSGEALPYELQQRFFSRFADTQLHNLYGPTEAAVDVSYHACERDSPRSIVPIGRPVANTQLYILDAQQQPVPVGVAGELHLGGVQLARGYLNRPELTAEKFIELQIADCRLQIAEPVFRQSAISNLKSAIRLYRTGDQARWLSDGEVEYLGRLDHQVKIRGFRIELGEIEAVLGEHAGVREAVVVAREDKAGDRRLVAYLIAAADGSAKVSELREYLGQRLPDYMVPSAFVVLEAFPLSPNGKVDRKALPAPDTARPDLEAQYVAPRTPIEKLIAQTWSEILRVERIGIHDNFFELGGDSLKAAVFVNRLQEEAGINCHLRVLFFVPHIAGLAAYCHEYYPDLVEKLGSAQPDTDEEFEFRKKIAAPDQVQRIDESHVAEIRRIITPLAPHESTRRKPKNPRAIFLLSPPRSGSTLLRVMLEGHPQLFSPPELELLSFNTLAERRTSFAKDYQMVLEGTIRALMEINQCDADTATRMMEEYERQQMSSRDFYQLIQGGIGERILVDKTPVYAFDPAMLARAEEIFDDPLYIHLVRHPYATIYSFIEARLDEYFFRYPHEFAPRELSELIWIISHQNILNFFEQIPAERQHRVYYEEIVTDPRHAIEGLCNFMQIGFHPDMLEPYKGKRMTDGIRPTSQMIGDLKFYLRREIDAKASERWRRHHKEEFLSEVGWQLAERLGYEREPAQPRQDTVSAPAPPDALPLKRAARDGALPLSFGQQRLWFLDQLEPGSPLYNIPSAVRFTGHLNVAVLERALSEIARRHEVLRTTFETVNGAPSLRIAATGEVTLPITDLRLYPAEERERQVELLAAEEARRPFDLARGPLLRTRLLQVSEDEHIVLFTLHHIVADGWSSQVIVRELGLLYEAYLSNQPSPLAELPIQYADYAAWQRELMQGERLQSQLDFWQRTLQGAPHLELPTDRPRPAVLTNRGARLPFSISPELFAQLETLGRREGVTLFMTLLAAFQTLLARYSNQDDISIGSPVANRNHAEVEGLIGFFVNTLVLRGDLSGNPTFRELLRRTRDTAAQAYTHQELPFEMLVDTLQPERSLNRPPLFQVMMTLNKAALPQLKLPGLTISPILVDSRTAKFDLTLSLVERRDGVSGALEYNTDLFDEATIARLIGHFERLLESAVSNPDEQIGRLRLLSEGERTQLLTEWSGPRRAFPAAPAIHERVATQARRTPDAIALTFEDQQLTYRELDDRASQLAHFLRKRGVTTGTLVGLCLERSIEMVVGLLGILKVGAAYLPLDLAYPPERLAFMLADAQVPLLLTQAHLQSAIANLKSAIELVCLDSDWPLIAQESTVSPDIAVQPDDLAYVIYTSGSTGKPKGCQVTHGNVVRLLTATEDWFHFDARDVWTFFHSHAFDFSVWEIWGALCYGGRLVVVPYLTSRSPEAFYQLLGRERVTVLNQTPSAFRQLMRAEEEAGVHPELALRLVIFGGEALELQTLRPWFARHGDEQPQLVNMYGITETTVHVTYRPIRLADVESGAGSVIGCPIPDLQIYVLDAHREPVPVGVPGELYVGGAGVSRGYLNRPELTAEKFIEVQIADCRLQITEPVFRQSAISNLKSAIRLYRTGDLARWLANGDLEYLGRIDQQVKIRGFRIELGEIEAVLSGHPAVQEVTVLVREDEPGVKRLAAYLVAQGAALPSQSELREYLKVKLPDYMVPSAFVWLAAIPLTANGKVDRRALPVPESERPDVASAYVAAQSEAEQALADIWQQVLGLKQVGVNDNFFELGGDSILSIQVIARARAAGLHLTPKQLFEHPTISALAAVAGAASTIEAEQGAVEGEAPLAPIQQWFFAQQQPEPWHWNQAVLLEVSQPLTQPLLAATLNQLLSHHDALRMRYEQSPAGWRQINAAISAEAPLQWCDLSAMNEAAQRAAIESTAQQLQTGLKLTGPLLRAAYFDCGSQPARLLLVIHHLVIDGVSWRVLLEDFQTAYAQLSQAQPVQLPPKTTSYKHWSERLTEYAQGDETQPQPDYWLAATGGRVGRLPVDFTNGENTEASARRVLVELNEDETKSLLHEAPQAYGTEISDVLLTALGQALTRWSGADAALVDLEGHGREDVLAGVDVSRTVGWFTTIYPVRLEVRQAWSEGETLKQIKEQLRRIPQRGIGYGLLRYLSRDEGIRQQLQAQPQAEVVFNYLGQFDQHLREGALFSPARESVGHSHSQHGRRHHLLEINGSISGGRLRMEFSYSSAVHQHATIERVAGEFIAALRALIAHCLAPEAVGYTPSDFADADLSQAELDALISGLSQV